MELSEQAEHLTPLGLGVRRSWANAGGVPTIQRACAPLSHRAHVFRGHLVPAGLGEAGTGGGQPALAGRTSQREVVAKERTRPEEPIPPSRPS